MKVRYFILEGFMVKICNYDFNRRLIEEGRDIYGIAYTQNILSGRYKT